MCMNDYVRCTKCEVQDRVCKHVIRCMKKCVPRFLIFEALNEVQFGPEAAKTLMRNFYVDDLLKST